MKINDFIASYKKNGFGKWAVIYKESNRLIGYCGIALEQIDNVDEREIGYRLDPKFWGSGLATEAASIVIQYGFKQLRFPYILGIVERENVASVRVLEKLGMKYKRKTMFYGVEMDIYQIGIEPKIILKRSVKVENCRVRASQSGLTQRIRRI